MKKRKLRNVSVTMILFREKEDEQAEKLRDKKSTDTPVHVDFPKGTSVADALEQKEELRQIGNILTTKLRCAKNLIQGFIGTFALSVDEAEGLF